MAKWEGHHAMLLSVFIKNVTISGEISQQWWCVKVLPVDFQLLRVMEVDQYNVINEVNKLKQ
jgi:hypothetical protein